MRFIASWARPQSLPLAQRAASQCPAKAVGVAGAVTLALAFSDWARSQVPLKPELERAAEARAMAHACREFQPEFAERIGDAFDGWWERNIWAADAVHALYFGVPSPERTAQQHAFEDLEQRLITKAERSRAAAPEAFARRCRRFIEQLESTPSRGPRATERAWQNDLMPGLDPRPASRADDRTSPEPA
jgi:hypothetical protein